MPRASSSKKEKKTTVPKSEHIKRPSNCFILFRQALHKKFQDGTETPSQSSGGMISSISKEASIRWHNISAGERKFWKDAARRQKEEHERLYPNYQFKPQTKEEKAAKKKSKSLKATSPVSRAGRRSTRQLVAETREAPRATSDPVLSDGASSSSSAPSMTFSWSSSSLSSIHSTATTPPLADNPVNNLFDPMSGTYATVPALEWPNSSSSQQNSNAVYPFDNAFHPEQLSIVQPRAGTDLSYFFPAPEPQLAPSQYPLQWSSQNFNSFGDPNLFPQDQSFTSPVTRQQYTFPIDPFLLEGYTGN